MIKKSSSTDFQKFLNKKQKQQSLNDDTNNEKPKALITRRRTPSPSLSATDNVSSPKNVYYIYNPKNVLITDEDVLLILQNVGVTGYNIHNIDNWKIAMTHRSYCHNKKKNYIDSSVTIATAPDSLVAESIPIQKCSMEGFEWAGDGILQCMVSMYLFYRFVTKQEDEGFLTLIRSKLVKKQTFAHLALSLGLDKFVLISDYYEDGKNGRKNASILEDSFEAFIMALFNDSLEQNPDAHIMENAKVCYDFIIGCLETYIDFTEIILRNDNYKDQLMRYYQRQFDGLCPSYTPMDNDVDENGNILYTFCIKDPDGNIVGQAVSRNKRSCQQQAAKQALYHFGALTFM
jgi:dsRNA-specific ribonuclease